MGVQEGDLEDKTSSQEETIMSHFCVSLLLEFDLTFQRN